MVKHNCTCCKTMSFFTFTLFSWPKRNIIRLYTKCKKKFGQSYSGSRLSSCYLLTDKASKRTAEGADLPCKCDWSCLDGLDDVHFHTSLRLFVTVRPTDLAITDIRVTETTTAMKCNSSSRDLFYGFSVPIRRN